MLSSKSSIPSDWGYSAAVNTLVVVDNPAVVDKPVDFAHQHTDSVCLDQEADPAASENHSKT